MTGFHRGCAKTHAFNLRIKNPTRFGNPKTKNAGDGGPKKAIEETILRFLGSRTFSHGLHPLRTSTAVMMTGTCLSD
jgi:hypothetical protein